MQLPLPRILFVDDDERNLRAAQVALADEAFELVVVRSGVDALAALMERDFSVIVLEMDELETARRIRERDKYRATPIVFVTAHTQDDVWMREAFDLGAVDFVSKPYAAELLRARLKTLARWRVLEVEQAQERFLATLAQELRNPLTALMLDLHALKEYREPLGDIRPVVASMERALQRLHRVVEGGLEISRLRHGRIQLRFAAVELGSVIARATAISRPLLDGLQQHLTLLPPKTPVLVVADADRLVQMVVDLISSSARCTDPGGHISLAYGQDEEEAWISVQDDGHGIGEALLPYLFELYLLRDRGIEGLELGRVREIVVLHGGRASASSPGPGRGSTLTLRWPRQPAAGARRLLLVDDNDDVRQSTAALLQLEGFLVEQTSSGRQGIELAAAQSFDLILLDLGMPEFDGFQTAAGLQQRLGKDTPPLVAITGFGSAADRARTQAAGFAEHLVKPVDPYTLSQALLRVLAVKQS